MRLGMLAKRNLSRVVTASALLKQIHVRAGPPNLMRELIAAHSPVGTHSRLGTQALVIGGI